MQAKMQQEQMEAMAAQMAGQQASEPQQSPMAPGNKPSGGNGPSKEGEKALATDLHVPGSGPRG